MGWPEGQEGVTNPGVGQVDPSGRLRYREFEVVPPTAEPSAASGSSVSPEPPRVAPTPRPVGWYRHRTDPTLLGYWDGERWRLPPTTPTPMPVPAPPPMPLPLLVTGQAAMATGPTAHPMPTPTPLVPTGLGPTPLGPTPLGTTPPTMMPTALPTSPPTAMSPPMAPPPPAALPKRREGRRHPRSLITAAEALVVAVVLVAVVAFVRSTSGPAHPAALSRAARPPAPASVATSTTTVVPAAPSLDSQVSEWWSGAGEPAASALVADLGAVQTDLAGGTDSSVSCVTLERDTASAASAPPPPSPQIEREWQLTLSASTRASAACASGRLTRLAGDLQPALYTLRDLSAQVQPYLGGQSP
jgi:hypothetical protein